MNKKYENIILADLIKLIHIGMIIFVLSAPLTGNINCIKINTVLIGFILYGWFISMINKEYDLSNEHKFGRCTLTEIECNLRGIDYKDGFILQIIKPFHKIDDTILNYILVGFTIFWFVLNIMVLREIDKK